MLPASFGAGNQFHRIWKSTRRRRAQSRQTTDALTFREPMLFENRKAPAVVICRLSFEASQVQTNTRDQESRANPNRAIPLYGNSREEQNARALLPARSIPKQ